MPSFIIVAVILLAGAFAGAAQTFGRPEDLTDAQARKDAQACFEWEIEELTRRGEPWYEHWSASALLQPPDNYLVPVTIRFKPREDGTWSINHGCVVYSCPPGTTGPWKLDRYWTSETEYHGGAMPPREEMLSASLAAIRGMTRAFFAPPTSYFRVREVSIPPDPQFKQDSADQRSWLVFMVCDVKKSNTRVEVIQRTDRFSFRRDKGVWGRGSSVKGEEKTIAKYEYDADFVRGLTNLGKASFDDMLGKEDPGGTIPAIDISDESKVQGWIRKSFSSGVKSFERFFGAGAMDRLTNVPTVVRAPGAATWRKLDGTGFDAVYDIVYGEKTGDLQKTMKRMRYHFSFAPSGKPDVLPFYVTNAVQLLDAAVIEKVIDFASREEAGDQLQTIRERNPGK